MTSPSKVPHGFDVILGNPPWLSYTGRQKVDISSHQLVLMVSRFPAIRRWPCSHSAFLLLQRDLLQEGGRCGFVLPRQIADLDSFEPVRSSVSIDCGLTSEVQDSGENSFPGVTQPVGLYSMERGYSSAHNASNQWPVATGATPHSNKYSNELQNEDGIGAELRDLLSLCRELPPFPPKTFSDPGVHTGNVSKKIVFKEHPQDEPSQGYFEPVREGKNITPFHAGPPQKWLWVDPLLEGNEYCRIRNRDKYTDTPILLRQTANRPIAARHSNSTYFRNSLLACHGVAGVPDTVVTGFLNSTLYTFLHRSRFIDSGQKAFPQVKIKHLHLLPNVPESAFAPHTASCLQQVDSLVRSLEAAAESGEIPAVLLDELDRLVLRAFGLSEEILPLLKEVVS